jgi:hypothetical protein
VVGIVAIRDLPATVVVPREAVVAESKGQAAHEGEDRAVEHQPKRIDMVEEDDAHRDADFACHGEISEQLQPSVCANPQREKEGGQEDEGECNGHCKG